MVVIKLTAKRDVWVLDRGNAASCSMSCKRFIGNHTSLSAGMHYSACRRRDGTANAPTGLHRYLLPIGLQPTGGGRVHGRLHNQRGDTVGAADQSNGKGTSVRNAARGPRGSHLNTAKHCEESDESNGGHYMDLRM